ncbi:hypothetical protein [Clostridium beijerinckii]|uniref:hypothetical protein n=1 Tax=Clostridium beijerinckii TaxID=1520 RepID=UPI000809D1BC|nr:hypothetical protein [Clostridium beijerinckii]OCA96798.1 hypothetical protein BGS1_05955 [Clostridium beijerinckii]
MSEYESKELKQELLWMQYRQKMLGIIEDKLVEMRKVAEIAKNNKFTKEELVEMNSKLNDLAMQIRALNAESEKDL